MHPTELVTVSVLRVREEEFSGTCNRDVLIQRSILDQIEFYRVDAHSWDLHESFCRAH